MENETEETKIVQIIDIQPNDSLLKENQAQDEKAENSEKADEKQEESQESTVKEPTVKVDKSLPKNAEEDVKKAQVDIGKIIHEVYKSKEDSSKAIDKSSKYKKSTDDSIFANESNVFYAEVDYYIDDKGDVLVRGKDYVTDSEDYVKIKDMEKNSWFKFRYPTIGDYQSIAKIIRIDDSNSNIDWVSLKTAEVFRAASLLVDWSSNKPLSEFHKLNVYIVSQVLAQVLERLGYKGILI